MDKRFQIFISSTYTDLTEERDKVMHAILELKCFPAGMELFPAVDRKKFEYIKSVIDECDFYILIIAARYGTMDKSGISWTEKEYNYAIRKRIPVLAFIKNDFEKFTLDKVDRDTALINKLERFKKKVEKSPIVNYWGTPEDLKSKVLASLHEAFSLHQNDEKGWVKISTIRNKNYQDILDKLEKKFKASQKHNQELEETNRNIQDKYHDLESQEAKNDNDRLVLEKNYNDTLKEIETIQNEISWYQNEVKKLEGLLSQKEDEYKSVELANQLAQQDNKKYQEQIDELKSEVNRLMSTKFNVSISPHIQQDSSNIRAFDVKGASFNMIRVEGGLFVMGASLGDKKAADNEKPSHSVTLSDYWIGETQVTQELWLAVMGYNPSHFKLDFKRPVECVSWYDCKKFIDTLNEITGEAFCMPTEAQWEFAARGGNLSRGYIFAGSNQIKEVAWYAGDQKFGTHRVGLLSPNELGIHDMSGNVFEWCKDWYSNYTEDEKIDPNGPSNGTVRVIRGGCWCYDLDGCRVSFRARHSLNDKRHYIGLRLALVAPAFSSL